MKQLFTFLAISISTTFLAEAKTWRVNNNAGASADFTTAQAAHNAASAGDTLIIESSGTSYGDLTLTKRLVLFGSGYFLSEYSNLQANTSTSKIGTVIFNFTATNGNLTSTSAGSFMSGLEIGGPGNTSIYVSNITITRCKFSPSISVFCGTLGGNYVNVSNISITQSYLSNLAFFGVNNTATVSNILVRNNIISGALNLTDFTSGIVEYNTFKSAAGTFTLNNATFQNNILRQTGPITFAGKSSTIWHNVFSSTYSSSSGTNTGLVYSNNLQNVDILTVFVTDPAPSAAPAGYTSDNRYKIKAGSPSVGAGYNGSDTGAFAGSTPYVLAGMPAIPSIYEYMVPASGQNSLNVKMSVRSNP